MMMCFFLGHFTNIDDDDDYDQLFTVNQTITMVISKEDKILTTSPYQTKGYGTHKLLKQFPHKNWTKDGLEA